MSAIHHCHGMGRFGGVAGYADTKKFDWAFASNEGAAAALLTAKESV